MKIKQGIFLLIAAFLLSSCAYTEYNAKTQTVRYWRIGNQELQGLKVSKNNEVISMSLESQTADNEAIMEILRIIRQLAITMP